LGRFLNFDGEKPLRAAAIIILAVALWSLARRRMMRAILDDRAAWALATFALGYASILAVSAQELSDRYTFINFLVLCLLSAHTAHVCWAHDPSASNRFMTARPLRAACDVGAIIPAKRS
jgi:hypothetical protein